jgi:Resolvase, N terminal domain
MGEVGHGDVVILPAVDRLSRDTTDLLVIARELQKVGAGLRSLAFGLAPEFHAIGFRIGAASRGVARNDALVWCLCLAKMVAQLRARCP